MRFVLKIIVLVFFWEKHMKSYQVVENGKPLIEKELEKPKASGKSILLKTVSCGICHSDVHIHDGFFELGGDDKLPISLREPLTMGHEVYGEVVEIGEEVKNISLGEKCDCKVFHSAQYAGSKAICWICTCIHSNSLYHCPCSSFICKTEFYRFGPKHVL